jgi:oxalate decarboxylase
MIGEPQKTNEKAMETESNAEPPTAATAASAQTAVPQPQRPGHGGTEPGPRNLERDRQTICLFRPYAFPSPTPICGWNRAAGPALYGIARITAIGAQGRNFVDDVGVGNLWYFPAGAPHSIQGSIRTDANFCSCSTMANLRKPILCITDWFKRSR